MNAFEASSLDILTFSSKHWSRDELPQSLPTSSTHTQGYKNRSFKENGHLGGAVGPPVFSYESIFIKFCQGTLRYESHKTFMHY